MMLLQDGEGQMDNLTLKLNIWFLMVVIALSDKITNFIINFCFYYEFLL